MLSQQLHAELGLDRGPEELGATATVKDGVLWVRMQRPPTDEASLMKGLDWAGDVADALDQRAGSLAEELVERAGSAATQEAIDAMALLVHWYGDTPCAEEGWAAGRKHVDPLVRLTAATASGEAGLETLRELALIADPGVGRPALDRLVQRSRDFQILRKLLQHSDPHRQRVALRRLTEWRLLEVDDEATIAPLLSAEHREVQLAAVEASQELASVRLVPTLETLTAGSDRELAQAARTAILRIQEGAKTSGATPGHLTLAHEEVLDGAVSLSTGEGALSAPEPEERAPETSA